MEETQHDKNITRFYPLTTREQREFRNGHKGLILWFTGLSGSGKSTLASALEQKLFENNVNAYFLDGDNLRSGLNNDLGFTHEHRKENIRRIAEVGRLFVDAGIVLIVATISPFQSDRKSAKEKFHKEDFIEVYIKCPLTICERRDPKGLYAKARSGEIQQFTGISQPYEEPLSPHIIICSHTMTISDSVNKLFDYIKPRIKR